jgi:hypothetical protein
MRVMVLSDPRPICQSEWAKGSVIHGLTGCLVQSQMALLSFFTFIRDGLVLGTDMTDVRQSQLPVNAGRFHMILGVNRLIQNLG